MARQPTIYTYLASWIQKVLQENSVLATYLSLLSSGSLFPYIFGICNMELEIAWLTLFN